MTKEKTIKIIKNSIAVIVILAMFIIIFYQNRDRDLFKFGEKESSKLSALDPDAISGFSEGTSRKLGDKIAFLSTNSYSIHSQDASYKTVNIAFTKPILHTESNYAVCYEYESKQLYVFKDDNELYTVTTDNRIFLAKVNASGYLFVATEKDGYNCECRVYNNNGEAIFKWDISKSELLDGDLDYNSETIVLSLASSGNNELVGKIMLIDISTAKIIKETSYNATMFFSVDFNNNATFVALGNKCLKYYNSDGTEKWTYNFDGKKLLTADVTNHNAMALVVNEPNDILEVNKSEVIILSKLGEVIGKKTYENKVESISVGDSCIAVAFDKNIYLNNSKMKEQKVIKCEYNIKKISLFNDDSHVFVLGSSKGKVLK